MKFLLQICIIFAFFSVGLIATESLVEEEPKLRGIFDGLFNKTINNLVASLPEPIKIAQSPISLNETGKITGGVNISDLSLSGLKKLIATKIHVSVATLTLNATMEVPTISLFSKYNANVKVLEKIPVFGNGNISATIDKIALKIDGKAHIIKGGISISNVTVSFTLGNTTTFSIHGLLNDEKLSKLLTQSLNHDLVSFLNDNEMLISKFISPIVNELLDALLKHNKTKEAGHLHLQELFFAAAVNEIASIDLIN